MRNIKNFFEIKLGCESKFRLGYIEEPISSYLPKPLASSIFLDFCIVHVTVWFFRQIAHILSSFYIYFYMLTKSSQTSLHLPPQFESCPHDVVDIGVLTAERTPATMCSPGRSASALGFCDEPRTWSSSRGET